LEASLNKSKFALLELKKMQKELKLNITSLQSKIEKLIFLHQKALEDNLKLQAAINSLQHQLSDQGKQLEVLEKEKIDWLNSNQMVSAKISENHPLRNEQIDEMVRDIDKCIALLSMNKKSVALS
jgi:chromosome segregation ATPase